MHKSTKAVPLSKGHVVLSKNLDHCGECVHSGFETAGFVTLYISRTSNTGDEQQNATLRLQIGEDAKTFYFKINNNTGSKSIVNNLYVGENEEMWAAITQRNEYILHGVVTKYPF
mgnify:CR=1 FL=1